MCFLRHLSSVFAVALLRDLVSPVDPLILCRCPRRQIYFPPRGEASTSLLHYQLMRDFLPASSLSCPVTLEFTSRGLLAVKRPHKHLLSCRDVTEGSAYCKSACPGRACLPRANYIRSCCQTFKWHYEAIKSAPIRLSVMHCQTKCPYRTALLPREYHCISSAMRRNCKNYWAEWMQGSFCVQK